MSSIANETAEAVRNGKSTAAAAGEAASSVVDEAGRKAAEVAGRVKEVGQQAAGYVRNQYNHLSQEASHAYESALDTAAEWENSAESFVNRRPLQSLLIAAGVGVVIGLLWKRHD